QRGGMDEGVTIASAPTVVSPASGQIEVYVRGSDSQLWMLTFSGGAWGNWVSLGGPVASGVAVAGETIFAQVDDGGLQESDGTNWTPLSGLTPYFAQFNTGRVGTPKQDDPYKDFSVDVEPGYFLGDGRSQIVVGYLSSDKQVTVALYQIRDRFTPYLLNEVTLPRNIDYFRIATGDFLDGDGIDEVAVAYVNNPTTGTDIVFGVDILSRWDTDAVEVLEGTPEIDDAGCKYSAMGFGGTLEVVSGNFDSDGQDEIAMAVVLYCWGDNEKFHYNFRTRVFDVPEPGQLNTYYFDSKEALWAELYRNGQDQWSIGLSIAAGDVDGDGRDELIRTWPNFRPIYPLIWPDLETSRQLEVYRLPDDFPEKTGSVTSVTFTSVYTSAATGFSIRSYVDRLAVGDLDRDLKEEIIWHIGTNTGQILRSYDFVGPNWAVSPDRSFSAASYPRLVTGDFTGEGLRVGPPTYRVQNKMASPQVFLNLPPMHRDILSGAGEIVLNNGATAVYSAGNTTEETSSSESIRDWSLSVGLEAAVGAAGHKVETSLKNTYGEGFTNSQSIIAKTKFEDITTAQYYDQVIYNATSYGIYEYPVYGVQSDDPATIAVVFPLVDTTTKPNTAQGRSCDENFYAPGHVPYNVWSYDRIDTVLFPDWDYGAPGDADDDFDRLVLSATTEGGKELTLDMSTVVATKREDKFHNQIEAGLEYSYENKLDVPLVGSAWDVSFKASAEGEYSTEGLSTLGSSLTEETKVNVLFPGIPDPSIYKIEAFLYWAKGGYLVVDYQTAPTSSGSWLLYDKPDPAFMLPWYGFPDAETGQFPSLPHPDAPPCGTEKQRFTHDIELVPAYAQLGDTVTMTATVRNFSNVTPPADVLLRFYLGNPATGNQIASCMIPRLNLRRSEGPAGCTTTWQVSGASGDEKIYAVIDPTNVFDEMHDEDDVINNNMGYGLLHVAGADYVDPGLSHAQAYVSILHEEAPGLGFGLYVPTTNGLEAFRYELVPKDLGLLAIVGVPIQALAFPGGEQFPDESHSFVPAPAGLMAVYRDSDLLPGTVESNLKLYRLDGLTWVDATCAGYQPYRFPEDNAIAVPICQTGTFVLSDRQPTVFVSEARFSADPRSGGAPLAVQFTDLSLNNPTTWEWDFGDGTAQSYQQNPMHIYYRPGVYTVTLTVSNGFDSDDEVKTGYVVVSAKLFLPMTQK
ncbi:MAG: PKD domain-containing protein, partial [Anaerolineae bacterium]|nr:PKD domain-containing protein [Anaerolineae bacterium]